MSNSSSLSQKQVELQESRSQRFELWRTRKRLGLIKLLPDKESFINQLWTACVNQIDQLPNLSEHIKKQTFYTLGYPPRNNWKTFVGKLSSSKELDLNTLTTQLFQTLVQELTFREKDFLPFWTPAYKELSEKLSLPIETVSVGSVTNSLNNSFVGAEEQSQYWIKETNILPQRRNLLPTSSPLFTSTVVDKWVEENTTEIEIFRSIRAKLKLSPQQRKKVDEWLHTSRFVYNKAVAAVEKGAKVNIFQLRDQLVTFETKKHHQEYESISKEIAALRKTMHSTKDENKKNAIKSRINERNKNLRDVAKTLPKQANESLNEWELKTPKDIRVGAIEDVCTAYKGCFTRLKKGQITHFDMGFRKKTNFRQCMLLPKSLIKKTKNELRIAPQYLDGHAKIKVGKKSWKEIKEMDIDHDCRLVKDKNEYFVMIPCKKKIVEERKSENVCGIDMGVRTFSTVFGNQGIKEIDYNAATLDKLNKKLDALRKKRQCPLLKNQRLRTRRRRINVIERRKEHMIDELHWKSIRMLLDENHLIFYGDIKSHDIVKGGDNKWLNRRFQDLKFYKFKKRLEEKCIERNRMFIPVKEHYTTQTCSVCGTLNDPGQSKTYHCKSCKTTMGRDTNAAKNMLLKGILHCI